jgi:hypothetical protein
MKEATPENIRAWRNTQQGTAAWLESRAGRQTASRMVDVMSYNQPSAAQAKEAGYRLVAEAAAAGIKGKESMARVGYRRELRAERLTGRCEEHFVTPYMDAGTEKEPYARAAYEVANDVLVSVVGFIVHPRYHHSGSSPDGLIGSSGGLEIKAPKNTTHLSYLDEKVIPSDYELQMQWNMACCEREWWDFVSFCPEMPPGLRIFIKRLERDDKRIAEMEAEVLKMEDEIQAALKELAPRIIEEPVKPAEDFGELGVNQDDIDEWMRSNGIGAGNV